MKVVGLSPIHVLVAVEREAVVGTASLWLLPHSGYVAAVGTDSDHRGRGIATELLERARALSERNGRGWLALDVEAENDTAIRLYRRRGYVEASRLDWYVGPTPARSPTAVSGVEEVARARYPELTRWVDRSRAPLVREALPSSERSLSHLELLFGARDGRARTWEVAHGGGTVGVVRGLYGPTTRTGVLVPVAGGPSFVGAAPALLAAGLEWLRTLGSIRIVVVLSNPAPDWDRTLAALGLPKVASSLLMIRSSRP